MGITEIYVTIRERRLLWPILAVLPAGALIIWSIVQAPAAVLGAGVLLAVLLGAGWGLDKLSERL